MAEVSEIIEFLKHKTGADIVSENSDIAYDLGVDGDDYVELLQDFQKNTMLTSPPVYGISIGVKKEAGTA